MKKLFSIGSLAGLVCAWQMTAEAGTNGFVVPTLRGQPGTAFSGWEIFSYGNRTNNSPDLPGSSRDAVLIQSQTNAFVTGSGNIYNISDLSAFKVSFASRTPMSEVVFQARTLGAELKYDTVKIHFDEGGERKSLAGTRTELDRGTTLGVNVSSKWEWNLAGKGVTVFNIEFEAAGASLSFDAATLDVSTEVIRLANARVDLDRWMYPFNATPGVRPSASVFAAFGTNSGVDTRDAQFLLGWNTGSAIPTGRGADNYLVHRARVTLTINRDQIWAYDGTLDDWRSYLSEADARHVADADAGRPVELFGAGYRNGFTAATFPEAGPFGGAGGGVGVRNVYAAGFDASGALIDVSNNVGKRDEDAFEAVPLAVGAAASLTNGDLAPTGTALTFEVDLSDPRVAQYFSTSLHDGALRLVATSLLAGSFGGPNFPQFFTKENALALAEQMPLIELEAQVLRSAPALQIAPRPDGQIVFRWPEGAEKYQLEVRSAVSGAGHWISVGGTPEISAGVASLAVQPNASAGFFRLRRTL